MGKQEAMAIEFYLLPYQLNGEESSFKGQVLTKQTLDAKGLIDAMLDKGSTATLPDITAVLSLYEEVLLTELLKGKTIHTKLFRMRLKVEGKFKSSTDTFDPKRHKVKVVITPSLFLQDAVKPLRAKRKLVERNLPHFGTLENRNEPNLFYQCYSGDVLEIRGSNLHMNLEDPEQGLYLLDTNGVKMPITKVLQNKPSSIMFLVPDSMPVGSYEGFFTGCTRKGLIRHSQRLVKRLDILLRN